MRNLGCAHQVSRLLKKSISFMTRANSVIYASAVDFCKSFASASNISFLYLSRIFLRQANCSLRNYVSLVFPDKKKARCVATNSERSVEIMTKIIPRNSKMHNGKRKEV